VCGRFGTASATVSNDWRVILVDGVPETTDEKLLVTECPRMVDMELSVSDEMMDRGRMYSTRSAKPTRAREGGRLWGDALTSGSPAAGSMAAGTCSKPNMGCFSPSIGVVGALPDRFCTFGSLGCSIELRSCMETAPDLRCA
jgi:hypothetical protein